MGQQIQTTYTYLLRQDYLKNVTSESVKADMNEITKRYVTYKIKAINAAREVSPKDLKGIEDIIKAFREEASKNNTKHKRIIDTYKRLFIKAIANKTGIDKGNFKIDSSTLSLSTKKKYKSAPTIDFHNIESAARKDNKKSRGIEKAELDKFKEKLEILKNLTRQGNISDEDLNIIKNTAEILEKDVNLSLKKNKNFYLTDYSQNYKQEINNKEINIIQKTNELINKYYKTPPINLYKGKLAEGLAELATMNLDYIAKREIQNLIDRILDEDKIQRTIYKKSIAINENEAIVTVTDEISEEYGKIDISIMWNDEPIGASVKNYNLENQYYHIGLHSGNFTNMIGDIGEKFDSHFLNIFSYLSTEQYKNAKAFEKSIAKNEEIRMRVYIATKKILLYRAMSGFGGEDPARLLIINDSSKANSLRVLDIGAEMKRIMGLYKDKDNNNNDIISKKVSVKLKPSGEKEQSLTKNLYQLYKMEKAETAGERMSTLFNKFHQTQLEVSVSNSIFSK